MADEFEIPHGFKTVSISEAAKIFGLNVNSAYVLARKGKIPTIRIGGKIRVPLAALQRMFDEAGKKAEVA